MTLRSTRRLKTCASYLILLSTILPFMSDRASIFEPDEAEKYDFKIERAEYEGTPAYVFRITPKSGYEKKVLYDELTTWFRKADYSILARNYSLSYHTLVYDFDVR